MTDQTVEPLVIVAKKADTVTTKVKLIKVDQDHNRLEGVGFKLVSVARDGSEKEVPLIGEYRYSSSGQVGRTLYTDKNGEIVVTNLLLGPIVSRRWSHWQAILLRRWIRMSSW
ncbi:TPA: SpaA isopeptide-forming pilin-related protein [Streptococcus pneumoniae]